MVIVSHWLQTTTYRTSNLPFNSGDNVNVLEETIGLLACLATDIEAVRTECIEMKVPETVLKLIDLQVSSPELVEMSLEALGTKIFY